ncbi:MAG: VOC family protein [Acidimicrobiales bacterium]
MTTLTRFDEGMPCWVDVMVQTPEQHHDKRAFLSTLFDWTWQLGGADMGSYALAQLNGHPVMGLGISEEGVGAFTTYFTTRDIEGAMERASELGASVAVPAMQVMDLGSMAILQDPLGAPYGLWQPKEFQGFGVAFEENSPGWFDHVSLDPERAGEFYATISGHDVTSPGPEMRVLENGEQWYASLSQLPQGESAQWKPVYIVDSLERIHEVVPRHGGTILVQEMPVPGSALCLFSEPINGTVMAVMRGGHGPEEGES